MKDSLSVLLTLSKEEREMFEDFAKQNNMSISMAIEFLAMTIIRPNYKPSHLFTDKSYNVQARLKRDIHARLKKKSSELGVSMKDMLLDVLKQSV